MSYKMQQLKQFFNNKTIPASATKYKIFQTIHYKGKDYVVAGKDYGDVDRIFGIKAGPLSTVKPKNMAQNMFVLELDNKEFKSFYQPFYRIKAAERAALLKELKLLYNYPLF
ncbi:MAG: hypothetical protein N3G80_01210 [Candidatus Micrarchaeota archaeon]|nr:hypothetical protein [Candidatus Micrarchaeota archaeon]